MKFYSPLAADNLRGPLSASRLGMAAAIPVLAGILSACSAGTLTPPPLAVPQGASETQPPSATSTPTTPTDVPYVPSVLRLTEPGCCVQPFWSVDSKTVQFFDKPDATGVVGIYGVSITGGSPQLISQQIGITSPDGHFLVFRNDRGQTIVRDIGAGTDAHIDNNGLPVYLSPTSQRLAWAESGQIGTLVTRSVINIASIDGSEAHPLVTVYNGGISGWLDDEHLLVAGRKQPDDTVVTLFSVDVHTNLQVDIASEQRMRSVRVAPGGKWVLYAVTLDPDNAANDGLWIISADGTQRYKLAVVGSAQWRDASHLLVIPLEINAPSHRLWQFDANTGKAGAITDPAITSFRVAGGDWSVSPDGKYVVFLNEVDQALWLITLPPIEAQEG